jgi:hypothetical protein
MRAAIELAIDLAVRKHHRAQALASEKSKAHP